MRACHRCGKPLTPPYYHLAPRKWCSRICQRGASGASNAERHARTAAEFSPGVRFGRYVVIDYCDKRHVLVRCDCGTEKEVQAQNLRSGETKSCGCWQREQHFKHGMCGTLVYRAWKNIKYRIFDPSSPDYPNYGGRGLTMEPAWVNDFAAFYAEVGPQPSPGLTIDRTNNDLGYVKGNLRWATPVQQRANQRRVYLRTTTCESGHEYTPENTYTTPNGYRRCRVCTNAAGARYRAKAKVAA